MLWGARLDARRKALEARAQCATSCALIFVRAWASCWRSALRARDTSAMTLFASDCSVAGARMAISAFSTVKELNKHLRVFSNYLRVMASAQGMSFTIQQAPQQ